MFKDYYKILCVDFSASTDEIKKAYRQLSLKWHPDRNPGCDVKEMMQGINEAYAILKDPIKKARYDAEYMRFKTLSSQDIEPVSTQHSSRTYQESYGSSNANHTSSMNDDSYMYDYDVQDEELKFDIEEARRYAKELVEQFLKSFVKSSKNAAVEGGKTALKYFIIYIAAGLLLALLAAIF